MADFFTKALAAAPFYSFRNKIMNVPPSDALAARGKARALSRARKAARVTLLLSTHSPST